MNRPPAFPCRRIGRGPGHHFFGYYNKTNWDRSGRFLHAQQVPSMDFRLTPESEAAVGIFDLEDGDRFRVFAGPQSGQPGWDRELRG